VPPMHPRAPESKWPHVEHRQEGMRPPRPDPVTVILRARPCPSRLVMWGTSTVLPQRADIHEEGLRCMIREPDPP